MTAVDWSALTPEEAFEALKTAPKDMVRFLSKTDEAGDCLEWNARRKPKGYGQFSWRGRMRSAHRVIYEMIHGSIPDGMVVMHTCDNPPCVNPDHLRLGTVAENNADMHAKGRGVTPRGEAHGRTTLTAWQVQCIRARFARGGVTKLDLSKAFRISETTAGSIIRLETWADVPSTEDVAGAICAANEALDRLVREGELCAKET